MNPETPEPSEFHRAISELLRSSQPRIEEGLHTATWRTDKNSLTGISTSGGSNDTLKSMNSNVNSNGNPFVSRDTLLAQLFAEMRHQLAKLEYDTFWDQGVEKVAVPRTLIDRLDRYLRLTRGYQ